MTEAAEVTPESEAVAAEREAPPGTPTPWNRRPPGTAWPPIRPAGPPHPGAAQPPASPAVHPGGPPRPGAADVVAGATPRAPRPGQRRHRPPGRRPERDRIPPQPVRMLRAHRRIPAGRDRVARRHSRIRLGRTRIRMTASMATDTDPIPA